MAGSFSLPMLNNFVQYARDQGQPPMSQGGAQQPYNVLGDFAQFMNNRRGANFQAGSNLGTNSGYTYENPLLKQIQEQAVRRIMQQQAATGRLGNRGELAGNVAEALLMPAYQMEQDRIRNLMGLTQLGAQSASAQGGLNSNIGNNISSSIMDAGNAAAGGAAGMFGAFSNGLNQYAGYKAYQNIQNMAGAGAGAGDDTYASTVQSIW